MHQLFHLKPSATIEDIFIKLTVGTKALLLFTIALSFSLLSAFFTIVMLDTLKPSSRSLDSSDLLRKATNPSPKVSEKEKYIERGGGCC